MSFAQEPLIPMESASMVTRAASALLMNPVYTVARSPAPGGPRYSLPPPPIKFVERSRPRTRSPGSPCKRRLYMSPHGLPGARQSDSDGSEFAMVPAPVPAPSTARVPPSQDARLPAPVPTKLASALSLPEVRCLNDPMAFNNARLVELRLTRGETLTAIQVLVAERREARRLFYKAKVPKCSRALADLSADLAIELSDLEGQLARIDKRLRVLENSIK